METLSRSESIIYAFDKNHEPIKMISSGTTIRIETFDCFQNQVTSEADKIEQLAWDQTNPATGPIYIEEAMPGDILKVKIDKIEIGSQGVMMTLPNEGTLGHRLTESTIKILPIKDDHVFLNDIKLPINKMIGVIGVAPKEEAINCGTPGPHGGNMDNKMITEGAILYLPVFVEDALFGLGDFHAAMGDGEIGVTGVEVEGAATVTLEVLKGETIEQPLLENEEVFTQIASAKTLDEASRLATELMANRIVQKTGRSLAEVTMLLSAAGQIEICQIVDPLMTVRFVLSKSILTQYNTKLI
ncbi:acetamidase/formamidase family protein [Viridibacillus sp. FSL H8-0110]|uniref:acetamidase/formamidase family protein n=1 Tax=Viridibacillus sp. FSL H8-0110 TaxID=2921376 RepID=UPI0030F9557C